MSASKPAVPGVTYEDVHQSFQIRLSGEQARLTTLADALRCSDNGAASAFGELEWFAHRLRGAAAVFDYPELRDAAKVLEVAANAAVLEFAPFDEPRVQTAIRTLVLQLTRLTAGNPPLDG